MKRSSALTTSNHKVSIEPSGEGLIVRPRGLSYPLYSIDRGAHITTSESTRHFYDMFPGPFYELVGIMWPTRLYLNKLSLITGRAGSGKSTLLKMLLQSLAHLFTIFAIQMRWLLLDPGDSYLKFLYQILPCGVEILRVSPQDADGVAWELYKDVDNELMNHAFQAAMFSESLMQKVSDPFWYLKGREFSAATIHVHHDKGAKFLLHDVVIPIKFSPLLKPFLQQSVRAKGLAESELAGRLGRDLLSTTSSVINKLAVAAAMWRHAKRFFSLKDFLNSRSVMHFAYAPDMLSVLSGLGNAMTSLLIMLALKRREEHNHTLILGDEGRYLYDLTGLDDLAAFGRASGLGAWICAQGIPGLVSQWGDRRTREFLDLVCTWITLSAGYETAHAYSNAVGQMEGLQESFGISSTFTRGSSQSSGYSGTTSNSSSGSNYSFSTTFSQNFNMVMKPAILPSEITGLPLANSDMDKINGFCFNPDVGAFRFNTDFLRYFSDLPVSPVQSMPLRTNKEQVLLPWTLEDLRRLNIELTPEMAKAMEDTWGTLGGQS